MRSSILKQSLRWFLPVFLLAAALTALICSSDTILEPSLHADVPKLSGAALKNPLPEPTTTRIAVMGDFGSGLPGQMQLAQVLKASYEAQPFQYWLLLGDLIYPLGDVQQYGQSRFSIPYKPILKSGVTLLATLGNHDIPTKNGLDAIRFFNMPARYYVRAAGPWADVFVIDSNHFNGVQAQWLKTALSQSQKPWQLVMGHHPAFSSGEHGNSAHLMKTLVPILEARAKTQPAGAVWYLAGHDHDYERFSQKNGVHYIISGGGGASIRGFSNVKEGSGSLVRKAVLHFLRLQLTASTLQLQAIDAQGQIIDHYDVHLISSGAKAS
ncbi:MAG: metallophosphoesterase [Vampirovibrionales bacterium]|nr:metallophosphoesterase [Vampirovibrionales bacterium]